MKKKISVCDIFMKTYLKENEGINEKIIMY